ncbi:MAG: cytochrome c biogenesis protein ResB [Halobacteriovoraceae bacterium]|nr:cytochrome c biogenesis protein ResB [Halobacteriovoraceae bacterium]
MKNFSIEKFEKNMGGLKFAVTVLTLFALAMVVGTFFESYFGTDFANRTVYKTWFFMLIQFGMFISISFAAFLRLPPKKRLYGFYTIHSGLITIGAGSFMTYYAGVDGSLLLPPNNPNREVILSEDVLKIRFPDEGRVVSYKLPYTGFATRIGETYEGITLNRYFPFAEKRFHWLNPKRSYTNTDPQHSSQYTLANEMVAQDFTLSLHPESIDFESSLTLGPLNIHYLPRGLANCFGKNNPSKLILWDRKTSECFTPEEKNVSVQKAKTGRRFLVVPHEGELISFFPEVSPWALNEKMEVNKKSQLRIFSKQLFEEKPNLFLFGESSAFYDKDEEKWFSHNLKQGVPLEIPWMGFELVLEDHKEEKVPMLIPEKVYPIQKNNEMVQGGTRAIELLIQDNNYWVTNESPMQLLINGRKAVFYLQKESLTLPFELVLTRFKMDKDPGTSRAASYESFVRLFSEDGPSNHHIYMNNPLKFQGFTFYQASYQEDRQGNYSSTLSVNVDPGRPFKYGGSLMLIFGSMWHYWLNYRRKKKKKVAPLFEALKEESTT